MPKRLRQRDKLQQIYELVDPRDNETRYVGRSDDVNYRYYQHLQGGDGRQTKYWIRELLQQGLSPILQILETIENADDPLAMAREREDYWIGSSCARAVIFSTLSVLPAPILNPGVLLPNLILRVIIAPSPG